MSDKDFFRYTDMEGPCSFFEPRPAISPYYVISVDSERHEIVGDAYPDRETAEIIARRLAEETEHPYHVVGCVSISSVPNLPRKASTRALV